MDDEILEEKEWAIGDYLALFDPGSPDHELIRQRSGKLKSVAVKKIRTPSGALFEDTVFTEHGGQSYVIRSRI